MVNLTWFLVSNIKHILILSKKVFKLFLIGPQKIFWQNSTLIRRLNVRRICLTSNIKLFLIEQHEGFCLTSNIKLFLIGQHEGFCLTSNIKLFLIGQLEGFCLTSKIKLFLIGQHEGFCLTSNIKLIRIGHASCHRWILELIIDLK